MSVNGFRVNGVVEKYNYNALDNISVRTDDIAPAAVTYTKLNADVLSEFNNKLNKSNLEDAGVKAIAYSTIIDSSTVTTAQSGTYTKPWATISTTSDLLTRGKNYRITLNEVEYYLTCHGWFLFTNAQRAIKSYSNIGNIAYNDGGVSGYNFEVDNVPFLITTNVNNTEGLYLFTDVAGSYTIKIEEITYTQDLIPQHLISGNNVVPVDVIVAAGYNSYNIGINSITRKRGNVAIGTANQLGGNTASAFGLSNLVSGASSFAFGQSNTITAAQSYALGYQNNNTNGFTHTFGFGNTASGQAATAIGASNTASGLGSIAIGAGARANHAYQIAVGCYNEEDPSTEAATAKGNYLEIVGNGTSGSERSNARTLDWNGNESLAGGITLGKGTADEVSLTAAQLKQLLALLT